LIEVLSPFGDERRRRVGRKVGVASGAVRAQIDA
jgi:hypothetical protein